LNESELSLIHRAASDPVLSPRRARDDTSPRPIPPPDATVIEEDPVVWTFERTMELGAVVSNVVTRLCDPKSQSGVVKTLTIRPAREAADLQRKLLSEVQTRLVCPVPLIPPLDDATNETELLAKTVVLVAPEVGKFDLTTPLIAIWSNDTRPEKVPML
jgi:hypothetical protein